MADFQQILRRLQVSLAFASPGMPNQLLFEGEAQQRRMGKDSELRGHPHMAEAAYDVRASPQYDFLPVPQLYREQISYAQS